MREQRIQINPFEVLSVLDYDAVQEPNEHGRATITALIRSDKEQQYLSMAKQTTWIEIMAESDTGEAETLFCGVLCCMTIYKESNNSVMKLEVTTGTVLLDRIDHTRSFQAENLTYRQLIDTCNEEYSEAAAIMTVGKGEKLPHFILQYKVTDWKFLKRMCTLAGDMIVPSCKVKGSKYFFGMPKKKESVSFNTDCYTIINEKILSYAIESREIHSIGESAKFMGRTFFIWKIISKMKGSELYHTYYISDNIKNMINPRNCKCEKMTGASLYGKIKIVEGESVKITILEDENKKNTGSRWFPFSTVYSSADGAGWYCMPEIGDKVRLYIPASDEADAYVCSAVHENGGDGVRVDPDHKIWRNKYGKEVRLTPDEILITNNDGTSIELSDKKGVLINSSGSVNIKAGSRIYINSDSSGIEMTASNKICIRQGDNEMLIQDGIEFSGGMINIM